MDLLQMAFIGSQRANGQEARSALPGAPVVAHVERVPMTRRSRAAVADGLRRLADVLAPRPARHAPIALR
jgi:hypothetical protein